MVSAKSSTLAVSANPASANALNTLGRHFSPGVGEAYLRFESTGEAADADIVIMAIVLDHMPDKTKSPNVPLADTLSLVADLGFDSVAITEMVFFLEDLFQMRITNQEIVRVRTVGDLRWFVRQKLAVTAATKPFARA